MQQMKSESITLGQAKIFLSRDDIFPEVTLREGEAAVVFYFPPRSEPKMPDYKPWIMGVAVVNKDNLDSIRSAYSKIHHQSDDLHVRVYLAASTTQEENNRITSMVKEKIKQSIEAFNKISKVTAYDNTYELITPDPKNNTAKFNVCFENYSLKKENVVTASQTSQKRWSFSSLFCALGLSYEDSGRRAAIFSAQDQEPSKPSQEPAKSSSRSALTMNSK